MVSRIFKGVAAVAASLTIAGTASANCGSSLYCGQSNTASIQPLSSWTGQTSTQQYTPSQSYSTLSSQQADSTYGTGSISETYSAANTYSFSGSPSAITGLGANERLQATNCPVNVHDNGEGTVLGCYNVVKPVARTSYYRVVRPVIYVRYPVPVAVPYTSPCHTVTHWSRYGNWQTNGRRSCR